MSKKYNNIPKSIDGVNPSKSRPKRELTAESDVIIGSEPGRSDNKLRDDIEASLDALMSQDFDGDVVSREFNASKNTSAKAKRSASQVSDGNGRLLKPKRRKWFRKKKIIVGIVVSLLVILLIVGAYAYTLLNKSTSIFSGNASDILHPTELKQDKYGRTNVLVFGTSEDDEGHKGALLTDSIMVLSVNQKTKDVAMFSIPRDLWIDYGMSCSVGSSGKINAVYACALSANNNDKNQASLAFANTTGKVFGLEIPYYIQVDYSAIKGITDALGGIDVDVYSADSRGLYDVRMNLKLPAGVNHLNGEQALALARARNSKGGYGLPRSNFDREKNQQRILKAMQKKALSAGVLANPQTTLNILNSLGENVKTNITMSELGTAIGIASGMKSDMRSIDISNYVKTGRVGAASVVMPTAGVGNYTELQSYVREQLDSTSNTTSYVDKSHSIVTNIAGTGHHS